MFINAKDEAEALRQLADKIENKQDDYENLLNSNNLKFKKLIEYPKGYRDYFVNPFLNDSVDFKHYVNLVLEKFTPSMSTPTSKQYESYIPSVLRRLEPLFGIVDENRKANEEIIEHNQRVKEQVIKIMALLGIKTTYTKYCTTGRQRNPRNQSFTSGFVEDLERAMPKQTRKITMFDKFKTWEDVESEVTKIINIYIQSAKKKEFDAERKERETQKAKQQMKVILKLSEKYQNGDIDATAESILDAMLSKDKYLMLAHYLLKNREDWSYGYNYASSALDMFACESDEDDKIESEIRDIINSNDFIDGRKFRDATYSYDYLFSLVDEKLYEDYSLLTSLYTDL